MSIVAKFQPSIGPAIPQIIELLGHSEMNICNAAIKLLAKLSAYGTIHLIYVLHFHDFSHKPIFVALLQTPALNMIYTNFFQAKPRMFCLLVL
jgi:hypothetical protein